MTLPSANCGARATTSPFLSTTIESPSKTSSSWPPIIARYAVVQPASWARLRTSSRRVSSLFCSYGEALIETQQPGPGGAGGGDAAAVLPEVLADGERDVDAVHADHRHRVARHEVPELVEDAVVGEVVLGERQHHLAAVQHRGGVLRGAGGLAVPRLCLLGTVEIADDHRDLPVPLVGEPPGERAQRGPRGLDEGRPQGQVLDGVTGQHHLGERDEMRTLLGGVPGPVHDRLGVAGEIADGRVDLIQSETKLGHAAQCNRLSDAMSRGVSRATPEAPAPPGREGGRGPGREEGRGPSPLGQRRYASVVIIPDSEW